MRHTKGPLKVCTTRSDVTITGFHAILTEQRLPTAYVATRYDAELYAYAPEMLSLLKEIRSAYDFGRLEIVDDEDNVLHKTGAFLNKLGDE